MLLKKYSVPMARGFSPAAGIRVFALAFSLAAALYFWQLLLGTTPVFATCVFLILVISIGTIRFIGPGTVAGVLIIYLVFRYVLFSQVLKSVLAQAGDSNLLAPQTTIAVLLVGISAICLAACIVSYFIRNAKLIATDCPPYALALIRNVCFVIGILLFLVARYSGVNDSGEVEYGGAVGVARQFYVVVYMAVLAETWRVLMLSAGRRSINLGLSGLIAIVAAMGFLGNSKLLMALPFVVYLVASIAYRRYISRTQIIAMVTGIGIAVVFLYPAIQVLRGQRTDEVLSFDTAATFVERAITEEGFLSNQWRLTQIEADDNSLFARSLNYLGYHDALLGRFVLIANTDAVVSAVDTQGELGASLVTDGFRLLLPTAIDPDKPRVSTADRLTWIYGLRTWDNSGNATVGLFGDSYAAFGWTGAALIPFILSFLLFAELQATGARLAGNFLACYFLTINLHSFGEGTSADFIVSIGRNNLIQLIFMLVLFYVAQHVFMHHAPMARRTLANKRVVLRSAAK